MTDRKGLPTISSYGQYENGNYGLNALRVVIGPITLYYSYETIVAFDTPKTGRVVCENVWSNTTGKHLNWIDNGNKDRRIERSKFLDQLESMLESYNLQEGD